MKLGLVLEGGANRTMFSAGVCDGLLDLEIMADHVTGVSAGIAYGANYVSRQKGRSLEILLRYANDDRYMGTSHMINPLNKSYFNLDFVFRQIPNTLLPYDYEALKAFTGTVEAVVTDLNTGEAAFLPVDPEDHESKAILASCALPMMFPVIEVDGGEYLDGGVADPIPIHRVLEAGCDRVLVVATRERDYEKKQEKTLAAAAQMYRKYPKFVDTLKRRAEIYNGAREEMFRLEKQGDILLYCPYSTTGFSRTEKNLEKIKALWQSGYDQCMAREKQLREYLSER